MAATTRSVSSFAREPPTSAPAASGGSAQAQLPGSDPSVFWPLGGSLVGIAAISGPRGTEYERPSNVLVDAPPLGVALAPESSPADEIREERRSESRVVHFRSTE
ncbi:hypothetical protein B0H13DRAFT_2280995 [Mycena leptocephala]|nr:hypothetical protein B0H13DRAFT_2280995 [Mycena leptocephala]